jgi:hypothetical protein
LPWSHAVVLAITLSFWAFHLSRVDFFGFVSQRDFLSVYLGARTVADGNGFQLYNLDLQRKLTNAIILPYQRQNLLPYIYPAYVAVLLSPLGKLPLIKAFLVWTALNFLAALWLARRLVCCFGLPPRLRVPLLVAFGAWVPLQLTLSHGQMGLLSAVALTESVLSLDAGKQWKAGLWLALGLVKPQLIAFPLLALVLWRCWTALASFSAALLLLLAVSIGKLGFWVNDYVRFLIAFNRSGKELSLYPAAMQNWRGLISALVGTGSGANLLLACLTIASVVLVAIVCTERRDGSSRLPAPGSLPALWKERFAIAILLGALTSPYLYFHDWVIAIPALSLLLTSAEWQPADGRRSPVAFLIWLIAFSPFVFFAAQFGVWPTGSPIKIVPWYMGLLTLAAIVGLRRTTQVNEQRRPQLRLANSWSKHNQHSERG